MKLFRILALAIAVIFFAASCNKDKGNKPAGRTSIQNRWNISTIVTVEPNVAAATYTGKDDDFVEFKADGTVSSSVEGFEQTQQYQMVDATHVNFGGSVTEIKELTNHKLVMCNPPHEGQVEKITYTLTK